MAGAMSGELPTDPARQRALLAAYGIPPERAAELRTRPCCPLHPTWEVQELGVAFDGDPAPWWAALVIRPRYVRAAGGILAEVWAEPFLAVVRRIVDRATGTYAEDVPEGTGGRRRAFSPGVGGAALHLGQMARHALDGELWRPAGGAQPDPARPTQTDLARTILRLASEHPTRATPPLQANVAGQPGLPRNARGIRDILRLDASGSIPWRYMYWAAASHARLLAYWEAAGRLDLSTREDAAYLRLSALSRAAVEAMLRRAGGATGG
jgi:alkylated DNA nucleotide flippase Atl1